MHPDIRLWPNETNETNHPFHYSNPPPAWSTKLETPRHREERRRECCGHLSHGVPPLKCPQPLLEPFNEKEEEELPLLPLLLFLGKAWRVFWARVLRERNTRHICSLPLLRGLCVSRLVLQPGGGNSGMGEWGNGRMDGRGGSGIGEWWNGGGSGREFHS